MAIQFHWRSENDENPHPVLFLHGFLGNHQEFVQLTSSMATKRNWIFVDLPGHGLTKADSDEDFSIATTAKSLVAFMQNQKKAPFTLVGYSMGARLALFLATTFPEVVRGAVLISGNPGLESDDLRRHRTQEDEKWAKKFLEEESSLVLEQWYQQKVFASFLECQNFKKVLRDRMRQNGDGLAQSLRQMGLSKQPNLWLRLESCKVPLRVVVGRQDEKFLAIAEKMIGRSQNLMIDVIEEAGHVVHIENEARVIDVLEECLFDWE